LRNTIDIQGKAATLQDDLSRTRRELDLLTNNLATPQQAEIQASLNELKDAVSILLTALEPLRLRQIETASPSIQQIYDELLQLQQDIDAIDQAIDADNLAEQQGRITETRERVIWLDEAMNIFGDLPPEAIVSPLRHNYANVRGASFELMTYYAPGVMALLLQHIAVTLGALSLVRERLRGSIEMFRVAPVTVEQMLGGKYLGYTVFLFIIALVLAGAIRLLGVPFLGNVFLFLGLALLLITASLGVGFLISAVSTSDSQAVQLSMLVLLLSIFFSGFFLPIENFWAPVRFIGYGLPLTHGVSGLQAILLNGAAPTLFAWIALSITASISFALVALITHLQFRRI
jgi:ABC-2 type transport system permease protein